MGKEEERPRESEKIYEFFWGGVGSLDWVGKYL